MNALVPINGSPMLSVGEVERVALAIAKGGLFGTSDPNAVLTLCFLAQAEGQHPAVVFRDYHLIQGKPAKKADAMLRDFVSAGGKVEWHALDDSKADATFSHPHGGTVRIDWTMQRAQTAGLSTPMWKKYPRQMLRSRVISEGVRTVYPGATSGLYEVGEVQDIVAEQPAQRVQEAVEHKQDTKPVRAKPTPLTGPYTTRAAARIGYGAIVRELHACDDEDALSAFLETVKDEIAQFERELPDAWNGDGADFIGLAAEIQHRRDLIAMNADDPNAGYPTPMEAG